MALLHGVSENQIMDVQKAIDLVNEWKINKRLLAERMGVNAYTLKMKLARKPNYTFTDSDTEALKRVLVELKEEINSL